MTYSNMTDEELETKYNGWRFILNKRKKWNLMKSAYAEEAIKEMTAIKEEWDRRENTKPIERFGDF